MIQITDRLKNITSITLRGNNWHLMPNYVSLSSKKMFESGKNEKRSLDNNQKSVKQADQGERVIQEALTKLSLSHVQNPPNLLKLSPLFIGGDRAVCKLFFLFFEKR